MSIPLLESYAVLFLVIALLTILVTRWTAVPYTLGLVIVGLTLSMLGLLPAVHLEPALVLFVFLPALLFEGAWSLKWRLLRAEWRSIFFLAGPGLLLSLVIIAIILHLLEGLDWGVAFLLAAILSPTDPVAVLSLFRQLHVDERLAVIIEGESLFNDGVAGSLYQAFVAAVLLSLQGTTPGGLGSLGAGLLLFLFEAGGGLALGLAGGWLMSRIVRWIDDPLIETTITIITAYGIYLLADRLHLSAIIAVISAGLVLGNYGRALGMAETTSQAVEHFWSVIAFVANALLFLLVGVQLNPLALLPLPGGVATGLLSAALAIGVVLLARLMLVLALAARSLLTIPVLDRGGGPGQCIPRSWRLIIFWGGLRGALSLALALALPSTLPQRSLLLLSTGSVVLFTLLVQGISMRWLLQRLLSTRGTPPPDAEEATEMSGSLL